MAVFRIQLTELNAAENVAFRRRLGLFMGAGLGLAYGLVSQGINRVVLPGVSLYQPPFGPVGNAAAWLGIGGLLGLLVAWPDSAAIGTFLASGLAALGALIVNLIGVQLGAEALPATIIVVAFLWLPAVGLIVPILGLFGWAAHRQVEAHADSQRIVRRLPVPVALTLLVGAVGCLWLYDAEARQEITQLNAMLAAGLSASTTADLPQSFRAEDVGGFREHAWGAYTLEWTNTNLNRFRIPRPLKNFDQHAVVVARFDNGWVFACLFVSPADEPICQGYEDLRGL